MVLRLPRAAPASRLSEERRGHLLGRFCLGCNQVFSLQRRQHSGDPIYGRDHVASPCPYEGSAFEPGASWWEPAVEVLPPLPSEEAAPAGAPSPTGPAGPPPSSSAPPPPAKA
jgi:hypothetical protein